MKTTTDVITDVIEVIKASSIPANTNGEIYRKTRPTESELEDTVVHIIPGVQGKFVFDGTVFVKIFYKNIQLGTTWAENSTRAVQLEALLYQLSQNLLDMPEYTYYIQSREIYTEPVLEVQQYYAILKINFKYLNS